MESNAFISDIRQERRILEMEPCNFETKLHELVMDHNDCAGEELATLRKQLIEREKTRRIPTIFERAFIALFGRKLYDV